jgi:hypothetical protein
MSRKIILCSFIASISAFGQNWTGFLVDADCYSSASNNAKPGQQSDRNRTIKACAPSEKTASFRLVDRGGQTFKLDAAGNARAAEMVRGAPGRSPMEVTVTGSREGDTLKVDSMTIPK